MIFLMTFAIAAFAHAEIRPDFEIRCSLPAGAAGQALIEMDLIQKRLHPMAGVHFFGTMRFTSPDEGGATFPIVGHPNYREFTFTGSAIPNLEPWEFRLVARDDLFFETAEGAAASLTWTVQPDYPYAPPVVRDYSLRCQTKDLRKRP